MFEKIITEKTRQNMALLGKLINVKGFYLAGGTALALQLGHRKSIDLDFFTSKKFDPDILAASLKRRGDFSLKSKAEGTLHGKFNRTRVTFLYYPYPVLFSKKAFSGIKLADWRDIACMKLDTISRRGYKKDFIDVYFIFQEITLKQLLRFFSEKYKSVDFNIIHVFKSLSYFEEAEKQPMPTTLKEVSWKKIKGFFILQTKEFKKEIL